MTRAYTETRSSSDDLAITFEVNGETSTIYVAAETIRTTSKTDLAKILGDTVSCSLCCYKKSGFAACMLRCVYGDGKCCDAGATNCE